MSKKSPLIIVTLAAVTLLVATVVGLMPTKQASAACGTLPNDKGRVVQNFTVPVTTTYTVWSRMKAPNTNDNSYFIDIDDGSSGSTNVLCGAVVGDTGVSTTSWSWVNYRGGNTGNKITVSLQANKTYTMKMVGRETGVMLDRVILTSDACVPSGTGDNCANPTPSDTTSPTVSVTAPSNGQTVSNTVNITANASDNVGVSKVEFLIDGQVKSSDTSAPYSYSWDSRTVANGSHRINAKAFDAAGNNRESSNVMVTTSNTVTQPTGPAPVVSGLGQRCLDNDDGRVANENRLQIWDCNGSSAQKWDFKSDGSVHLDTTNFCLDAKANGTTPGTIVQLYTCNDTAAQKWEKSTGNTIKNPSSGLCLAVKDASNTNGAQTVLATCNSSSAAQKWYTSGGSTGGKQGDIDNDGDVDLTDFGLLKANFGKTGSNLGRSDIDNDGDVDLVDFGLLKANFGK